MTTNLRNICWKSETVLIANYFKKLLLCKGTSEKWKWIFLSNTWYKDNTLSYQTSCWLVFICFIFLYFYMAATWCTYTNSTEKIHASVSERWTKTGYAVKACFSVTVKEEFCGAAKTEKTFNQQMQFCFYTTQKLSVKQHPQKGLILFKETKHCHVKQLNLLPLNNHLTIMKTGKPVGCERYFPSRESHLSIGT